MRASDLTMSGSRWLDAEAVAKIMRVRASQLPGMVGRGRIPRPSYHLGYGSPRWDREMLEASIRSAAAIKRGGAGKRRTEETQTEDEPAHD